MSRKMILKGKNKLPLGSTWILTTASGSYTVLETGTYLLEMHGGGGGGGAGGCEYIDENWNFYYASGSGGGGSGGSKSIYLTKGDVINYTCGAGGIAGGSSVANPAGTGGTSTFGETPCFGGAGGYCPDFLGSANGGQGRSISAGDKLSSDGGPGHGAYNETFSGGSGGQGNINNPSQTYGDGGKGWDADNVNTNGQPGAIILSLTSYS